MFKTTVGKSVKNTLLRKISIGIGMVAGLCAGCVSVALADEAAKGEAAGTIVLAVGDARLGEQGAKAGATVHAGDRLRTGANGYIHIQTVDNGFLILRPQSTARVAAYHIDSQNPGNNRIKIELEQGVARSISGEAVKSARQNFRFNTPVAAIGVRGTDFTVFTDQESTRIQVVSGGVVASGFGGGCLPEGTGPCEGAAVRELFASQAGQLLQVSRGQAVPQLLRSGTGPDTVAPPRSDEPSTKSGDRSSLIDPSLTPLKLAGLEKTDSTPQIPPGPPAILWGRWQAVAEQAGEIDLAKTPANYMIAGLNAYYAMLRNRDSTWQAPASGVVGFALQGGQAAVQVDGVHAQAASIENGKLTVNFNNGSFTTQFDLLTQAGRLQRQAEGGVGSDGTFSNPSQYLGNNNMVVQGVLTNGTGSALNAAYLFQSRLDDHRVAYGATYWSK